MSKVSTGDLAPDFSLPAVPGDTVTLSDSSNLPLVLFFYPKDDTSGCTREAVEFTEHLSDFEKAGFKVAGISPNPIKMHEKFRAKHGLTVPLISDEEKQTLTDYGVWVEKSMYGRKYMGVERTTLVIGKDRKVLHAWHKVKVPGHVAEVLQTIQED